MRRFPFGAAVLAGALLLGALIPTLAQSRGPGLVGDVNGDGRITSADALAVYAFLAGRALPPSFDVLGRGDADGDGAITRADAELIMRAAVGKSDPDRPVGKPQSPGALPASGPMMLRCEASVATRNVSCTDPGVPANGDAQADRITYGGQNVFVKLISSDVLVTADTFAFNVRLVNLIPQPIGTEDGVNPDTLGGVRVFFSRPPTTTSSNGPANVVLPVNHHGEASFIGSEPQRFYGYPGVLAQGDTAPAQRWKLQFGENVTTFSFLLYVSSPVQFAKGWVDVYPKDTTLFVGSTVQLVDTVRSQVGKPLPGVAVNWSSTDNAVATVSASGLVTAVGPGVDTIVANAAGPRTGRSIIRVLANPASYRVAASDTTPAAGDTITVTAQVVDGAGNPVPLPGRTITWSVTNARGTFSVPTSVTDNSGLATVSFYADSVVVAGTDTLKATDGTNGGALPFSIVPEAPARYQVVLSDTTPAPRDTLVVTAQLADRFGNAVPLAGRAVDFTSTGGAQFADAATDVPTDAGGKATVRVVPNDTVGKAQTVTATDDGPVTGTSPEFVTQVGTAAKLAIITQPSASAQSGLAFAQQPVIQVQDVAGNPVAQAGLVITAAIASGDPALGGTTTATTTASGAATFTDLAITGTVGDRTLSFTANGLASATSGTIAVAAGAAAQLALVTQPSDTAQSGVAFPRQPVIQLRDASGNPVSQENVTITAEIASGAGTLAGPATANTNAAGQATFASLTITGLVGDRTLTFTSGALTEVTSGTVVVTAGAPSQLVMVTQPSTTAQSGAAFGQQPVVQLQDAAGNAVGQAGVTVTAAIAIGGGTLGGTTTANTNAAGAATFTDLSIPGLVGARTLSFNATGVTQATSGPIEITAGAPANMSKQAGTDAQSGTVGSAVANPPSVLVTDAAGNPVSGLEVTFAVATGGGSVTGGTATTSASGVATVGSWTLGNTAGANSLTATAGALTVTFTATGTPGLPALITKTTTDPQTGSPGTAIGAAPSVTVTDAFGNVVPGATINFTVTGGGGSVTGGSQTTSAAGVATAGSWTPGSGPGINTLQVAATTGTAPAVTFTIYVPPIAGTDASEVMGNTRLTSDVAPNVLANDQSPNGGTISITTTGELTTERGAKLTLAADGSFEYNPVADMLGRDSVQYTINDTYASSNGWIKLRMIGQVWYVQSGFVGTSDGRDGTPFGTLSAAQAVAGVNDTILVRTGTANAGSATLKAGQLVYGQGASAPFATTLNGKAVTLLPAGTAPNVGGLVLASGNTIRGFNSTGAITGTAFGTLTVSDVSINNATGQALSLATGTLVGGFTDVNSGGGTNNLALVNVSTTAPVTLGQAGNTFAGAASDAVVISGGNGSFIIPATVSNTASRAVNVTSRTGGDLTFSGSINPAAPGAGITVASNTGSGSITFSGAAKRISSTTTNAVVLTNNTGTGIQFLNGGLEVATTTGTPFTATGGGTLVVSGPGNTISTSGNAARVVDLLGVTIGGAGVSFSAISSSGTTTQTAFRGQTVAGGAFTVGTITLAGSSARGIDLTSNTAPFSFNAGTVSNAVGELVYVSGGDTTVSVAANLNQATAGRVVSVVSRTKNNVAVTGNLSCTASCTGVNVASNTGGTVTFSGGTKTLSTGTNPAVTLASNTGATVEFTNGGLAITTGTGNGFNASGGGTLAVTTGANANTISSAGGVALSVQNTTIGASGLTFRSISANGGASGIVLASTGSQGSLTVTGDGVVAGSGGTIQNTTSHGVSLSQVLHPRFNRMAIQNTAGSGVNGTGVSSFTFTNNVVSNSGTGGAADGANLDFFANTAPGTENNLSGTVTIQGNTLSNANYHGIDIFNYAGTIDTLGISNNVITTPTSAAASLGHGIRVIAFGSTGNVATITRATLNNNTINNVPAGVGLQVQCANASMSGPATSCGQQGSATNVIRITNNQIRGQSAANPINAEGLIALVNGVGQGNFLISGNTVENVKGTAISHSAFGNAQVTSTITNNTIVANNINLAQGIGLGTSYTTASGAAETPQLTSTISNNTISQTNGSGILTVANDVNGTVRVKVLNNNVAAPTGGTYGIQVRSGSAAGNNTVCARIEGNTTAGGTTAGGTLLSGIGIRKQGTVAGVNTFGIHGLAPSPATSAQAETSVESVNPASAVGANGKRVSSISGANYESCNLP